MDAACDLPHEWVSQPFRFLTSKFRTGIARATRNPLRILVRVEMRPLSTPKVDLPGVAQFNGRFEYAATECLAPKAHYHSSSPEVPTR